MFRLLRKIIILILLLALGALGYHYLSNPLYQREILQTAQEVKEELQEGEKKPSWSGPAVVVEALKGDTVVVNTERHPRVTVRLAGIDAPEPGQPLAEESRRYLAQLVKNKAVNMTIFAVDFIKRPLVLLTVDDTLINAKMVAAGLAEAFEESAQALPIKIQHAIENAQWQAKQNHVGIWGLTNYQRPSEYRIRHLKAPR